MPLLLQFAMAERCGSSEDGGVAFGKSRKASNDHGNHLNIIADRFNSLSEVTVALKRLGIDNCGLIFGNVSRAILLSNDVERVLHKVLN